jgi:hypothetical protein
VLLLTAAGCGGSGDDEDGRSGTTADTAASSTTQPDGDTTTTVAAEGPAEWVDVARGLYERDYQMRADPDPDRVADLYAESCSCWEAQLGTVEFLADNDQHIEGQAANVLFVKHEQSDPETGLENLTVQGQTNPLRRVSADGDVIEEIPPDEPSCIAYALLADGPDGSYRIYSQTTLPACPEEA